MKQKTDWPMFGVFLTLIVLVLGLYVHISRTKDLLQGQINDTKDQLQGQINDTKDQLQGQIDDIKDLLHTQQDDMRDRFDEHVESLHPRPLALPRTEKDKPKP